MPGIKTFIVFCYRRAEINSPYFVHGGLIIINTTMLTTGKKNSSHVAYYGLKILQSISLTPGIKTFTLFRSGRAENNSPYIAYSGIKIIHLTLIMAG
jgi:hypothetical protein